MCYDYTHFMLCLQICTIHTTALWSDSYSDANIRVQSHLCDSQAGTHAAMSSIMCKIRRSRALLKPQTGDTYGFYSKFCAIIYIIWQQSDTFLIIRTRLPAFQNIEYETALTHSFIVCKRRSNLPIDADFLYLVAYAALVDDASVRGRRYREGRKRRKTQVSEFEYEYVVLLLSDLKLLFVN